MFSSSGLSGVLLGASSYRETSDSVSDDGARNVLPSQAVVMFLCDHASGLLAVSSFPRV